MPIDVTIKQLYNEVKRMIEADKNNYKTIICYQDDLLIDEDKYYEMKLYEFLRDGDVIIEREVD